MHYLAYLSQNTAYLYIIFQSSILTRLKTVLFKKNAKNISYLCVISSPFSADHLTNSCIFLHPVFCWASIIVGQEINAIEFLSADGNTYEVTVDLRGVTNIPEGAELVVKDVAQSEYDNYLNKAAKALKTNADAFTYAKLLDISIVYEGQKIQPNGKVGVEIQLKDGEDISNPQVVHFGQKIRLYR